MRFDWNTSSRLLFGELNNRKPDRLHEGQNIEKKHQLMYKVWAYGCQGVWHILPTEALRTDWVVNWRFYSEITRNLPQIITKWTSFSSHTLRYSKFTSLLRVWASWHYLVRSEKKWKFTHISLKYFYIWYDYLKIQVFEGFWSSFFSAERCLC